MRKNMRNESGRSIAAALAGAVATAGMAMAQTVLPPPVLPTLNVKDVGPMEVKSLDVKASVNTFFATVESTFVFRNPNNRVLEGELTFPLPDRAAVCGYALDVNGALVDGVVVPKEEARVAFESETRRRVDPGLVEHVKGNVYKTRVYPIPANGTRTVKIVYNTPLALNKDGAALSLPMPAGNMAKRKVTLEVAAQSYVAPKLSGLGDTSFMADAENIWRASREDSDLQDAEPLLIALPQAARDAVVAREVYRDANGRSRLFTMAAARDDYSAKDKIEFEGQVDIYWDASGSRANSASNSIRALEQIGKMLGSKISSYNLRVFRNEHEPLQVFDSFDKMLEAVRAIDVYDGGTRISFPLLRGEASGAHLGLLFSDGFDTLTHAEKYNTAPARMVAFVESTAADFQFLRRVSRGNVVNLATATDDEINIALQMAAKGTDADGSPESVDDGDPVKLKLGPYTVTIKSAPHDESKQGADAQKIKAGSVLATAWAAARIEELSGNPDENEDELLGLGRKFGIAGPKTSLLVLETLDQWLRYKIEPPASQPTLRQQWAEAMKRRGGGDDDEAKLTRHIAMLRNLWADRLAWWKRDFDKDPLPPPKKESGGRGPVNGIARAAAPGAISLGMMDADAVLGEDAAFGAAPAEAAAADGADPSALSSDGESPAAIRGIAANRSAPMEAKASMRGAPAAPEASITIKGWSPDVPYLKAIKAADKDKRYDAYLEQRKEFATSPAFYLDCADYFFAIGEAKLAVRILTNLAELRMEDAALLRALAWRLRQAKEYSLAIEQFRRIAKLRPEDGQSFRDLAMTLTLRAKDGPGEATMADDIIESLQLYKKTAFTPWGRHADVLGLFALEEMNAIGSWLMDERKMLEGIDGEIGKRGERIIAAAKWYEEFRESVEEVDKSFASPIDVDVRIIMEWDADNTDIDLHVIEPSGEEAYYGHNRTRRGGLVSRDVTDGFGPEEYMIRKAAKGEYEIFTHYFGSRQQTLLGPATVTATVFTNWGRANEESQTMSLRLEKQRDKITIGSIKFTPSAKEEKEQPKEEAPAE